MNIEDFNVGHASVVFNVVRQEMRSILERITSEAINLLQTQTALGDIQRASTTAEPLWRKIRVRRRGYGTHVRPDLAAQNALIGFYLKDVGLHQRNSEVIVDPLKRKAERAYVSIGWRNLKILIEETFIQDILPQIYPGFHVRLQVEDEWHGKDGDGGDRQIVVTAAHLPIRHWLTRRKLSYQGRKEA